MCECSNKMFEQTRGWWKKMFLMFLFKHLVTWEGFMEQMSFTVIKKLVYLINTWTCTSSGHLGNAVSFLNHRGRSTSMPFTGSPHHDGKTEKNPGLRIHTGILCQSSEATNWNFIFCVILCLVITPVKQFLVLHLLPHLENQTSTYGLIIKIIFFGKLYCLGGWNPVTNHTFRRRSVLTFTFELLLGGEAFQAISVVWELGKSWKHWTFTIWESWKHIPPIKSRKQPV